nr:MAG TPA: Single-strand binding protein strand beta-sheet extended loops.85A [Caudoviricetes sp.]
MNVELTGTIVQMLPYESGTSKAGKEWRKQVFILETQDQYPRKVAISLLNDNIDKYVIQVGKVVTANLDIESREWGGKWYTEVRAWQVTYPQAKPVAQATQPTTQAYPQQAYPQQVATPAPAQPQAAEDLPF